MSPGKKTALMFLGALMLFFALAFLDEYENLITPFLSKGPPPGAESTMDIDVSVIAEVLMKFNSSISGAYLSADPSQLYASSMDEQLRRGYIEEIAFLKRSGRVMDMRVSNVEIKNIEKLSLFLLRVEAVEFVSIRYLKYADGAEIVSHPEAKHVTNYTMELALSGWKIVRAETIKVERREG